MGRPAICFNAAYIIVTGHGMLVDFRAYGVDWQLRIYML